jgi:GTP-binding protein HflX
VIDYSSSNYNIQIQEVKKILKDLDIHYERDERVVEVYNKIDKLPLDEQLGIIRKAAGRDNLVAISALTGEGLERLSSLIEEKLSRTHKRLCFRIPVSDGKASAWLYQNAHVLKALEDQTTMIYEVDISPENLGRFCDRFSYLPEQNEVNQDSNHYA